VVIESFEIVSKSVPLRIFARDPFARRSSERNEMVSVIAPVVFGLFESLLRKGILANENDNCPLQKFSAAVVHPVVSGAYTLALRDQIRRERAEETSYGQRFQ
jgi:hypothetical protein